MAANWHPVLTTWEAVVEDAELFLSQAQEIESEATYLVTRWKGGVKPGTCFSLELRAEALAEWCDSKTHIDPSPLFDVVGFAKLLCYEPTPELLPQLAASIMRAEGVVARLKNQSKSETTTPADAAETPAVLEYRPLGEAAIIFGFGTWKKLDRFLQKHPEIIPKRPMTKAGKPHERTRRVSILQLARAVFLDDRITSDPKRQAQMKARLEKAQLSKELEEKTLAALLGKSV